MEFEDWFKSQSFYKKMIFIHGESLFLKDYGVYRVLAVEMAHQAYSSNHLAVELAVYREDMQKNAKALSALEKFLEAAISLESGMQRLAMMQDAFKKHFGERVADSQTWVLSKQDRLEIRTMGECDAIQEFEGVMIENIDRN